jgi:hypothetical protein
LSSILAPPCRNGTIWSTMAARTSRPSVSRQCSQNGCRRLYPLLLRRHRDDE